MKKAVKKLLITSISFVLIFNIFLPFCSYDSKANFSGADLSLINGKKDLLAGKHNNGLFTSEEASSYNKINKLEIYADAEAVDSGRITINQNGIINTYDNTTLYIKRTNNDDDYVTVVKAKMPDGSEKEIRTIEALNPINLSLYDLEVNAKGAKCYVLDTQHKIRRTSINKNALTINLKKNKIVFSNSGNSNVLTNNIQCANGTIKNYSTPLIYVKQGGSVKITSKDAMNNGNIRSEYVRGDGNSAFKMNGSTITAVGDLGSSANLEYVCNGSSTRFIAQVSNMASGTCQLKRGEYEEIDEMNQGYRTCKSVGVSFDPSRSNTLIELVLDSQFEGSKGNIRPSDVIVEDMTGCLNSNPKIQYTDNSCKFTLDTKKKGVNGGVISVKYPIYTTSVAGGYNQYSWHQEYWALYNCDTENMINQIVLRAVEDALASYGGSGSSEESESDSFIEEAEAQIVIPDIPVNLSCYRSEEGNSVIYDVVAENSQHTYYTVAKRSNVNVPCNINGRYNFYYGDGNNVRTKITVDKTAYEDGIYDVIVGGENDTGTYKAIIDTIWAGKSHTLQTPHIMAQHNGIRDEKTGSVKFDFKTEYCSEVKYKVIKRTNPDTKYDESILRTYDGFDGTVTSDPNEFSITVNPNQTGSGYYDIVLYGINRSLYNEDAYIYSPIDVQKIFVNAPPQIVISKVGDKNTKTHQQYKLEASSTDRDNIEYRYYYVRKKQEKSDISLPSADEMKLMSMVKEGDFAGEFTSGDIIDLDKEKIGGGYFDIIVYSEDEYGIGRFEYVQNIKIADDPGIQCEIQDEVVNKNCSIASRFVQNASVIISDDIAKKYDLEYCYTADDITNGGEKPVDFEILRKDSKYKIYKFEDINVGAETILALSATEGVDENVYLYLLAKPKDVNTGFVQVMRTGSIRLNGSPMELQLISANKEKLEGQAVGYGKDENLEIKLTFNQEVDEDIKADLYINIGEDEVKQDSVRVEDNKVIYTYELNGDYDFDYVTISRLDYNDKIYAKNTRKCFYDKDILQDDKIQNDVSGCYFVDTVKPQVDGIILNVVTDESNVKYDAATNTKYVTSFDNVTLEMKYDEVVKGNPAGLFFIKGKKYAFYAFGTNTDDQDKRREDEYDIMQILSSDEVKKFEGELVLDSFFGGMESTEDFAGNKIQLPENPQVTYMINGEELGNTKLVFDERVYEPEIFTSKTKIEEDGTYLPNTNFTLFGEYDDDVKTKDLSGVTSIKLELYFNVEQTVNDCSGSIIFPDYESASDKDEYLYKAVYTLNKDQLPLTFRPNTTSRYLVRLTKEDYAGNTSELEKEINIHTNVSFSEEDCGFANFDNDSMVSIKTTTAEEREYTVALKLEDLSTSDITVSVINPKTKLPEELELIADKDPNTNVAKYKLDIDRAGQFPIIVRDQSGKIIFNDFLRIYNMMLIGDANFDGTIDGLDLIAILRYIAKFPEYYNDEVAFAGDVNHNGFTDVSDVVMLSRFIVQDQEIIRTSDGYYKNRGN